ncbi:MAG: prolipoprotein diacylglyceryl transferase [Candidatus Hydrogenedentes bacterium]|nr:prolipoprotein diacylglyceryl transferase [Candidatus Hydrogenedentota bacterium]
MFPTILKLGPVSVHSYGLMMAIAFLLATYLATRDIAKHGLNAGVASDTAFWCLLVGLAGTRILHIIMFPEFYSWSRPLGWIAIWQGGLVFQGAIPPALAVIYFNLRRHQMPFWKTIDIAAPYVALGHAIGRVGCFLNGCCYGQRTDLPWGVQFPRIPFDLSKAGVTGSPAYMDHCQRYALSYDTDLWSLPVHPTQLYSVAALCLLCVTLLLLRKCCWRFPGFIICWYFILYSAGRFVIEMFRGDHNPTRFLSLSDQQVFCVLSVVAGLVLLTFLSAYWRRIRAKNPEASTENVE